MGSTTFSLFKEQSSAKLFLMLSSVLLLLLFIFFVTLRLSKPAMVPLFRGLNRDDSIEILSQLEADSIPYNLEKGGAEIFVPSNKVLETRMKMAKQNLPNGNAIVGYEIFDKSENLGVSSFVYNVNLKRALEGELGRTISSFKDIKKAKVHLVIPTEHLFSKSRQKPTASVVLEMINNKIPGGSEIDAVSHLVATAVPGLSVKDITIVDTQGRALKRGLSSEEGDLGNMVSSSALYKLQYERHLKEEIENLLEKSLGFGSIEAQVSAEMDFDRIVTDSEIFDPDGQVIRSFETVQETEATKDASGNVSVQNELPEGANQANSSPSSQVERVNEVTNYEVSKTIRKHIKQSGSIKRLTVAVLLDGKYSFNKETSEYEYIPRTEEELKQVEKLTKSAIGFDKLRGDLVEVVNMKFSKDMLKDANESSFEWIKRDLSAIVRTLVTGIVIILTIVLVIKPIVRKFFDVTNLDVDSDKEIDFSKIDEVLVTDTGLPATENVKANMTDRETEGEHFTEDEDPDVVKKNTIIEKLNKFIEENPEEFSVMIRQLINKNNLSK